MNRRGFFRLAAAVPVAAVLPAIAKADDRFLSYEEIHLQLMELLKQNRGIYAYADLLTSRAQFLCKETPQVFGETCKLTL